MKTFNDTHRKTYQRALNELKNASSADQHATAVNYATLFIASLEGVKNCDLYIGNLKFVIRNTSKKWL